MSKIKQGILLQIFKDGFFANPATVGKTGDPRPVKMLVGDIIEIRYPFAWHFRTLDNHYYEASEETILEFARPVGKVFENVSFSNKATTEEIIRLRLYETRDFTPIEWGTGLEPLLEKAFHKNYERESGYIEKRKENR